MPHFPASANATAGPSTSPPRKPHHPFVSADRRPERYDAIFRVLLVSSGSVASVKMPDIAGALSKNPYIALQIVATPSSLHFYSQEAVDASVRLNLGLEASLREPHENGGTAGPVTEMNGDGGVKPEADLLMNRDAGTDTADVGVKVWRDADEWSDWKKVGDPILHIELRRWADIVVVTPCSADFLAKVAGGLCDNLALSVLRALPPDIPVILCPAMNTHMYQHPFTADHLKTVQERLGYMVLGPQGTGKLACGDDGPGKMTDWRDIVSIIEDYSAMFHQRQTQHLSEPSRAANSFRNGSHPRAPNPDPFRRAPARSDRPRSPPTPGSDPKELDDPLPVSLCTIGANGRTLLPLPGVASESDMPHPRANVSHSAQNPTGNLALPPGSGRDGRPMALDSQRCSPQTSPREHWRSIMGPNGGDGSQWEKKWWMG